jgi:alpha-glucosidase
MKNKANEAIRSKILLGAFILFASTSTGFSQKSFQLYSPDSSIRLEIKTGVNLSFQLFASSDLLVSCPTVDMKLDNGRKFSDKILVSKSLYGSVNEVIDVPVPYRRKKITNRYNWLKLVFREPFGIEFRLYNNGIAYRVDARFRDSINIESETALFDLDPSAVIWFAGVDKRPNMDRFHTSFEAVYKKQPLGDIADTMLTFAPVAISLSNNYRLAITDANLFDYPGMFLQKTKTGLQGVFAPYPLQEKLMEGEFPQYVVSERAGYIARTNGTRAFPWRTVLVARNDIELPSNDIIYLLGDASKITDFSWIKYGKGTDEWITGINLFDVPFVAGLNTASYKYYIDFAKKFGFDQVMLDAGWSDTKDLFRINPAIDMDELLRYAKSRGIRLMLWTLCATLDKQLDSALQQFNNWGISSIMTDFMDRDDQKIVNFYHRVAKACADHKISIMFHGAYAPKGFNRTWPNVLTHEGVLGSEWNIWSDLPTPDHDVTIAYTRMLAGPLDYEPGLLQNAQKDQFRPVAKNPMSQGTRCHQLAMFIVYDSPLQIFSGNISQGLKEPAFMELLGSIPTTWDETKIVQGKIGEFIITARRHGNDWFIGGLNNTVARDVSLSLDFIPGGTYEGTICKDGVNANSYGADYSISEMEVQAGELLKISMAMGGGFMVKLSKK